MPTLLLQSLLSEFSLATKIRSLHVGQGLTDGQLQQGQIVVVRRAEPEVPDSLYHLGQILRRLADIHFVKLGMGCLGRLNRMN